MLDIINDNIFIYSALVCLIAITSFTLAWFIFKTIIKRLKKEHAVIIKRYERKIAAQKFTIELLNERIDNLRTGNLYKNRAELPITNIKMLDNLFSECANTCREMNIDFNLKINGSIPNIIQNEISGKKLGTVAGELLQNAINAIEPAQGSFRSILMIIGRVNDYYALVVYDSGIKFNAETLARLREVVGKGFDIVFKIVNECGASLIIDEKKANNNDFTKSVTISFDKKNQYIIKTYRPEAFPKSEKYIIEDAAQR